MARKGCHVRKREQCDSYEGMKEEWWKPCCTTDNRIDVEML